MAILSKDMQIQVPNVLKNFELSRIAKYVKDLFHNRNALTKLDKKEIWKIIGVSLITFSVFYAG